MQRRLGQLLTGAGLLVILASTLIPIPSQTRASEATPIWCLVCGEYGGVDVINNVLLFIPLGLGLRLLNRSIGSVVATGATLSFTIELLQLVLISGRDASLSDLITNSSGTSVGAMIGARWRALLWPTKPRALRLAAVGAILWLVAQLSTAFLLRPWIPDAPLRSEWSPRVPTKPRFNGRVISATVSGLPAGEGVLPGGAVAAGLSTGGIQVELTFETPKALRRWTPVFRLVRGREAFLLVESFGTSVVLQAPARSQRLRLRPPRLAVPGAVPAEGGVTALAAGERHDTIWAASVGGSRPQQRYHVLSPSQSWSLIVPFSYSYGPEAHLVTASWLTLLLLPIAYWSRRRFNAAASWAAVGLLLVVGLGLIPHLADYPAVHWSEWLAGLIAATIGEAANLGRLYLAKRCDSPSINGFC